METANPIVESPSDSFLVIRKRKPRFEIEKDVKDIKISNEEDFNSISKTAHAYAKEYSSDQAQLETFKKLGVQIGNDFQFQDQGAGVGTLAEQIQDSRVENRDCKLPTFLLAASWNEVCGDNKAKIVYLNANLAHPYVQINIDGSDILGHFVKPRLDDLKQLSAFEMLTEKQINGFKNSLDINGARTFDAKLEGMVGMDQLSISI